MNIAEAKKIDLVDYLAKLGHHPSKIRKEDYWFSSPLRDEKTPSFKVNRRGNVWYDHGTGQGGNFVDFAILYHGGGVKELLHRLDNNLSFHQRVPAEQAPEESPIKILTERNLVSISLLRYLRQRRISEQIACKYCREISFSLHGKTHRAIGFRNSEGGFELRNPWFKGSSSPKAITRIENGADELLAFEGFFDFISYRTIQENNVSPEPDYLILNSTALFEKSRTIMEQYRAVRLFLDGDKAGQKCTAVALSWGKKFGDESHLYKGYKDLNEWVQQIGKSAKQGLRRGP